jgi:hypothetical protein
VVAQIRAIAVVWTERHGVNCVGVTCQGRASGRRVARFGDVPQIDVVVGAADGKDASTVAESETSHPLRGSHQGGPDCARPGGVSNVPQADGLVSGYGQDSAVRAEPGRCPVAALSGPQVAQLLGVGRYR